MWSCICFDLDNTLLDYEAAFEKGMKHSFKALCKTRSGGYGKIPTDQWFEIFKKNCDDLYEEVAKKQRTSANYKRERFIRSLTPFGVTCPPSYADQFHQYFYSIVHQFVEPYPQVHRLLNYLQKNHKKIGIITNGKTETQKKKMIKSGISSTINDDYIFISESVGAAKPNENIFMLAKEEMAETKDETMLFVGDSWELDVVGAINAGWDAIYLNTRKEKPSTSHKPIAVFHDIEGILQFFKSSLD